MDIQGLQLLESCAFTWVFDGATRRFRRAPREAAVDREGLSDWRPYHHLEIDGSRACFRVTLDEAGSYALRAWIHVDPCVRCSPGHETLGDSKQRILWWKEQLRVVNRRVAAPRSRHPLRPFGGWSSADGAA
ncbi:MAG: hypothetical protein AB1679_26280 [Actinomycetota bacterium]